MYSLLIDTHDTKVVFVLYKDGNIICKNELESNMRHSEIAMPSLVAILSDNNIKPKDLGEILVNIGPGSFTGVRIGVVIAKTMAYLLNIPIKTINSLEMLLFSNDSIIPGVYVTEEKNGYFVAEYDSLGKVIDEIKYVDSDDFENVYKDEDVIRDVNLDYENIYKHMENRDNINPHLVNPLYVKQIEALK